MPARKSPADWKPRTIALLRKAAELGGVVRAAHAIGEKRPQLIEETIAMSERTQIELFEAGEHGPLTYNKACALAADRLEAA